MRIIPDFNKYSSEWQRNNPANLNTNNSRDFNRYWEDRKASHNKYLDELANKKRSRSISIGKGIGVLGGGLVGGLTGNLVGGYRFNKKNLKDQFIEKYLYENPLAGKLEAESAYNKLRKKALIKSSLLGAGLGAGVGFMGGSKITRNRFNKRLLDAKELGEGKIFNRKQEIRINFGDIFGDNGSIDVQDYYSDDGRLHKRTSVEKLIRDNNSGDKILTNTLNESEGGARIRNRLVMNKTPKINKEYLLNEPILNEGKSLSEGIERLKTKFNNSNKK